MRKLILLIITALVAVSAVGQIYEPVKWHFEVKNITSNSADVTFKAKIDEGWHLYGLNIPKDGPVPTKIVFESIEGAKKTGELKSLSKLIESYDPNFDMKLNWYAKEAIFVQKISFDDISQVKLKCFVEFMVCNDESCLPPAREDFGFGQANFKANVPNGAETVKKIETTQVVDTADNQIQQVTNETKVADYWKPVIEELRSFGDNITDNKGSMALLLIFLAGLAGGFLALFTPCVWPIIPMTVSFFLKRSENKGKGQKDALLYGLSIIFIYVTLGILITLIFGSSALNDMSTNAVFNILFFLLLVVFAISFFGAFEITLPSAWSTKLDAKAEKTTGIISILLMAFVLALVSFSCTGPIIGFMLVEISTTGSILAPAIAMFGFAVALAIPFTLFAFFPSWLKTLPKSGGWLNKVKVVLAFIELALALKFLSVADLAYGWRILDREVFLALWIVIFILLGFYLLGKIRFPHDDETKHTSVLGTFLAIISFSFAVYMIPGLWGAPLKSISAFSPPLYTQDFNLYKNEVHAAFDDYDIGMAYAAQKGLPVVVDFSGFGCVNCRKMEASVWTHPKVKDLLEKKFVLITLFVDDKKELSEPYQIEENGKTRTIKTIGDKWSYLQRVKFGANAQPFYVMLDNQGMPLNKPFTFDENPKNFIDWLEMASN